MVTSSFGFTNSEVRTSSTPQVAIAPIADYAKVEDEATTVRFKNKTAPIDQQELLSYECAPIKNVSSRLTSTNPGKVKDGIQYIVRLDEILRTVNDDDLIIEDDNIVMYLTVRHTNNAYVKPAHIETLFKRLNGALTRADGTYRFDELMLSALNPTE